MSVIDTAPLGGAGASAPTLMRLSGDIDILTLEQVRRQLMSALNYSNSLLVLDLSQVTFCGADGLGMLLGVRARARARGITLVLTGLSPFMTRLLHASGLDRSFPVML
ncbi:STAS domain-containing protein [Nonomuraea endophytica]|uniref:STAS domain-containing protein n=1 Tax=Nonomuraea endophytica TaxID=714136 RepID=UPI0037C6C189